MRSSARFVANMATWYTVMIRDVLAPELVKSLHHHITLWKVHHHARR